MGRCREHRQLTPLDEGTTNNASNNEVIISSLVVAVDIKHRKLRSALEAVVILAEHHQETIQDRHRHPEPLLNLQGTVQTLDHGVTVEQVAAIMVAMGAAAAGMEALTALMVQVAEVEVTAAVLHLRLGAMGQRRRHHLLGGHPTAED